MDSLLWFIMAEGFHAKDQLEEDHTNRPNVNFRRYVWVDLIKALRSLVPVSTHTLRSQLDFVLALI